MNNPNNSNLILCATPRLARALRQSEWHKHQSVNTHVWNPTPIQPLSSWWSTLLQEAVLSGQAAPEDAMLKELSALQESLLWEQVIHHHLSHNQQDSVFNEAGLAQSAIEANRFIIEWNISLTDDDYTVESLAFNVWRDAFQKRCREHHALESVRFRIKVLELLKQGACQLPEKIFFAGYERKTPHIQTLIETLQQRGVHVADLPLRTQQASAISSLVLDDQQHECRMAVAWAKQQLSQSPNKKIAIVVPELNSLREKLLTLLDEVLLPYTLRLDAVEQDRPYDISLGVPLASVPIIATALHIISCAVYAHRLTQTEIARLLHNPYFSDTQVMDERAKLDAQIRENLALSVTPKALYSWIAELKRPRLENTLEHFQALWRFDLSGRHLPSVWSGKLRECLHQVSWAQGRALTSHEFQAHKKFMQQLDSLIDLDGILGKVDSPEILSRLMQICRQDIFQAEAPKDIRLQVMGMLEGVATPIDAIWVMGMNDHIWPPMPRPNPFIPAELQRKAASPNADSHVQTAFAQQIQQRLLHSAEQVIFSYAKQDGDKILRISPLIKDVPEQADFDLKPANTLAESWLTLFDDKARAEYWQWLEDSYAPAIPEDSEVSGGTGLLKAQAICPAWAFYQYRLYANALADPVNGLDSMQRGELVHQVLQYFWDGKDSSALQAMSEQTMQSTLQAIAGRVMQAFSQQHGASYPQAFIALEQQRLVNLVSYWLREVELKREHDFTVLAVEEERKQQLQHLRIRIKMDRVDRLSDGRLILIDYKTGKQIDIKNWAKPRIHDPQLPFYCACVLQQADVAAVLFGKVWFDNPSFYGISQDNLFNSGVQMIGNAKRQKAFLPEAFPDWDSVHKHWRDSMNQMASEIAEGLAIVRFEQEDDLKYCEVKPLLRLAERQLQFEYQQVIKDKHESA